MTDQLATSAPTPSDREAAATVWARTRHGFGQGTWSLRRRLALAFVVAGAVLAIGAVLGALSLNGLVGAVNVQVNQLDPAARNTGYLLASLLNEETGVRGYVLTREQSFLKPYQQGMAETATLITTLHRLIDSYPGLRSELRSVEESVGQWRTQYAEPAIASGKAGGPVSTALESTGKNDFDQIRAKIGVLNSDILAERRDALNRLHAATTAVVIVAITGAVAVIAAAAAAWAAMNGWVIRPLAALGEEAQVVASGGVDHELKINGPREVMQLAADVEAMRRQLRSSMTDLSYQANELERSNRELEQFAYVASHDLQEPLRKVASFCQMLESRYAGQLDDRARQYIAFAVDGAKRMQLLINELLTFSRVGQPGTARGPVDLNAVASEAVDRLDATITDTDAQVTVARPPHRRRRRDTADSALPEPDRQLDQVQADGRAGRSQDHSGAEGRSLGIRLPGQRNRHRSLARRAGLRDLPATASEGRVSGHRNRARAVQEDRRLPRRSHLGRHRGPSGIRYYNPVDTSRS